MKRTQLRRRVPLRSWGNAKTRAGQERLAAAKADVAGRSGGWCEANTPGCRDGRHVAAHFHHVLPRSQGGQHDPGNLLHVCASGHAWIHDHPAVSYEAGWLRRRAA